MQPTLGQLGLTLSKIVETSPQETAVYFGRGLFSAPGPRPEELDLGEAFVKLTKIPSYLKGVGK